MGQRKHGRSGLQGQAGNGGTVQSRLCCAGDNASNAVLQQAVKAYLEEHPEQKHTAGDAQDDETEARRAALLESIKGL